MSAFVHNRWVTDTQLALFSFAGLLAIRNAPLRRRTGRAIISAAFVVSLLMIVVANHHGGDDGRGVASIWTGLLLLAIVVTILRQTLTASEVTLQSIYAVISAYLIIGLMYAAFYAAMYYLSGRTFFANRQSGNSSTFQYFSFTTLTTLGYGDFTAAYAAGRAVAMLEAMTGQIFLATLVAKLVGSFRPASRAPAEGSASQDP
jgi:ion channel